ncbi:MAG TPA: hypothetical protein VFL82_04600, partial [Thermomicrobiales bacterium]|nr:hypothetical protein [Thermomicrobiales bacterium]
VEGSQSGEQFTWHPRYKGKTVAQVAAEIHAELEPDQRQYALVLEGAEAHENQVLASVLDLEKKWGIYDMDWATADPTDLANRIAAFELERDRRHDLFSYEEYRRAHTSAADAVTDSAGPWWAFWKR